MADPTAIFGAVSGALALFVSFLQELRHRREARAHLALSAGVDDVAAYVEVVNRGRRVTSVRSLHALTSDGAERELSLFMGEQVQQTLGDGDYYRVHFEVRALDQEPPVTGLYVVDSLGTRWELPHTDFMALQDAVRTAIKRGQERQKAAEAEQARTRAERDARIAAATKPKGGAS
jgi:hypothetical protein